MLSKESFCTWWWVETPLSLWRPSILLLLLGWWCIETESSSVTVKSHKKGVDELNHAKVDAMQVLCDLQVPHSSCLLETREWLLEWHAIHMWILTWIQIGVLFLKLSLEEEQHIYMARVLVKMLKAIYLQRVLITFICLGQRMANSRLQDYKTPLDAHSSIDVAITWIHLKVVVL